MVRKLGLQRGSSFLMERETLLSQYGQYWVRGSAGLAHLHGGGHPERLSSLP